MRGVTKLMSIMLLILAGVVTAAESLGVEADSVMKPLTRVKSAGSSGSGVLLYSDDRGTPGEYRTFVLTNWHVVSDAIHIEQKWDSIKKKYIHVEANDRVTVEVFTYLRGGRTVIAQPIPADIRAYDADEDLALLELDYPLQIEHCAQILPKEQTLVLLQKVYAVGCALGDDTICTIGHIMDLEEYIDGKAYFMVSSNIIYGSSGGGVFVNIEGAYYFVGVPSRVRVMRNGETVSYMGYAVTPERLREFFTKQSLDFLTNVTLSPAECFARRQQLQVGSPSGSVVQ